MNEYANGYVNIDVKDLMIGDNIIIPNIYKYLVAANKCILLTNITNEETSIAPTVRVYGKSICGYVAYEGQPIYIRAQIVRVTGSLATYSYRIDTNDTITRI